MTDTATQQITAQPAPQGAGQHFSIGDSFSQGWQLFKEKWMFVYLVLIITTVAGAIPSTILGGITEKGSVPLIILFQIISFVWSSLLSMGMVYSLVRVARREPVELVDVLKPAKYLGQYAWGMIVFTALVMGGSLLFIVPGIYFALKYSYMPYLISDKGMSASEAFKMSAQMTKGVKLKLMLFGVAAVLFNIVGVIPFGLGLIVTLPVTILAQMVIYKTLLTQLPNGDAVEGEMMKSV